VRSIIALLAEPEGSAYIPDQRRHRKSLLDSESCRAGRVGGKFEIRNSKFEIRNRPPTISADPRTMTPSEIS